MSNKKGLSTYHYKELKTMGHAELLGLPPLPVIRTWGPIDPRLYNDEYIEHLWFPCLWGDTIPIAATWAKHIPHDYGKESKRPRPEGYSWYADDGYDIGNYYEFVDAYGKKKRVRLAYFLNEPDAKAHKNAQGHAESAGMTPKVAAHLLYFMATFWPHLYWVAPCLSGKDFFNNLRWLEEFIDELLVIVEHVNSADLERAKPFSRWVHTSFHLYPKGFHLLGPEDVEKCDLDFYIKSMHELMERKGMWAQHRKYTFITETNSPPAYVGPDFPAPDGDYSKWGPKSEWPGAKRWRKWIGQMNENKWVVYWMAFIGTHPVEEKQKFVLLDKEFNLTANGEAFSEG